MVMVACPSANPSGRAKMGAATNLMEHLGHGDAIRQDVVGHTVEQDTWMDDGHRNLFIPLLVVSSFASPSTADKK
eukprot:8234914-Ditylum_brightwellii.AAC.1